MKTPRISWCFLLAQSLFVVLFVVYPARAQTTALPICTEAALRAAVSTGGSVVFACDGVITVSRPLVITNQVALDTHGRKVVLSGGLAGPVFDIRPNGSLTLSNLSIVDARSAAGAGIRNEGSLRVLSCIFSNCFATGINSTVTNGIITAGGAAEGGAIWNAGVAEVSESRFIRNFALGARGPVGTAGPGGLVFFPGAYSGRGGAIHNRGQLEVSRSLFTNNVANGGDGNAPLTNPSFGAGNGGDGRGGAIFNLGTAIVRESAFVHNNAYFGSAGGSGANPGPAFGGALCNEGSLHATNVTIVSSEALGHPGAGGGIAILAGSAEVVFATLAYNFANGVTAGDLGLGAGIFTANGATARLSHDIVAYPRTGTGVTIPNVTGPFIDLGHNLGSDTGAVFTAATSANGVDPLLTPWADFGGPTPAMAPRAGSRAVDGGAVSALAAVDQRGLARPFGDRPDIGAVEGAFTLPGGLPVAPPTLIVNQPTNVTIRLRNDNRAALTQFSLSYLPGAGANLATNAIVDSDCPGTPTFISTEHQLDATGLSLDPDQGCTLRFNLFPTRAGSWLGEGLGIITTQLGYTFNFGPAITILGPPTVRTLRTSEATSDATTLNGSVIANGTETSAWFEYGPDTNAPSGMTPSQLIAAGFTATPLFTRLTGLPANTKLLYRTVSSNFLGIARGEWQAAYTIGDVVVACEEGNLSPLVARGGIVRFACDGVVTLSSPLVINTNTTLLADGHQVTLSGSNAVRLFQVPAGRQLTLHGLTLANGSATEGGAVHNLGTFNATACEFIDNRAKGAVAGGIPKAGSGGAVWNGGTSALIECRFSANSATGSDGIGGVVINRSGGAGQGGAVGNFGFLTLSNCTLSANRAVGGLGGSALSGATPGGPGQGGAVFNAQSIVAIGSTFQNNTSVGGVGGLSSLAEVGGDGFGGGVYSTATFAATNCTFAMNEAVGGVAGRPGFSSGRAYGGAGAFTGGQAAFAFTTFAANRGTNGGGTLLVLTNAMVELSHVIIAQAGTELSIAGPVMDRGYNFSTDQPGGLTNETSRRLIEPKLGPLAQNGGPTPTMALLSGSPVIDAGAAALTPSTDQRGRARPAGAALDPGAYEGVLGPLPLTLKFDPESGVQVGASVSLQITLANTNTHALTGIRFTNQLPAALAVAGPASLPPGFDGSVTTSTGSHEIVITATIPPLAAQIIQIPLTTLRVGRTTIHIPGVSSDQFGPQPETFSPELLVFGPPEVQVSAVSAANFTSATLQGFVHSGGAATRAWYEYGPTPSLGLVTAPRLFPVSWVPTPAPEPITGLAPGTDYYYQLVASNEFGIVRSAHGTFFTLGDVNTCDDAHLRANVARGGPIRFGCNGIILLNEPLVVTGEAELDATGRQITVRGQGKRVFTVTSQGTLVLRGLTIADGRAANGAGIFNQGRLVLDHCTVTGNAAIGTNGAPGQNGASAPLRPPAPLLPGESGHPGDSGGPALGGAVYNDSAAWCFIAASSISGNTATGGVGGVGGNAGFPNGPLFNVPTPGGQGGPGGAAMGGGIYNRGDLILSNVCLSANQTFAGKGGTGGGNYGFGFAAGGSGGLAKGGALHTDSSGTLLMVNVTVSGNSATGGAAGGTIQSFVASGGSGLGGGLSVASGSSLLNCTIAFNRASGGPRVPNSAPGTSTNGIGLGGNLYTTGPGPNLHQVILAHAKGQANGQGQVIDMGHNLSSDASCALPAPSSAYPVDPGLAPLEANGGPTLTHALLPSSPAIDAGDPLHFPPTDQRSAARPALGGPDIGAYEVQPIFFGLRSITATHPNQYRLRGFGVPNTAFRVLGHDGSAGWTPVATGTVDPLGVFDLEVTGASAHQIFRTTAP